MIFETEWFAERSDTSIVFRVCLKRPECLGMFPLDIEAQIREIQGKKPALDEAQGVGLDSTGYYDQEIYGGSDSRFAGYVTSIAATELEDVSDFFYLRSF